MHNAKELYRVSPASSGVILSKKVEFWKGFAIQATLEIQDVIE